MPMTIWRSFKQALPQTQQLGDQVVVNPKPSGTTSAACTPPRCCVKIPIRHWDDLAKRLCFERFSHKLKDKYLPEEGDLITTMFKSEADVVDASTLYLTYPVHVAYKLVYPNDSRLNQLTKPSKNSSRTDMAYFSGRPNNEDSPGDSDNIFAVMEYKRLDGLSVEQFKSGIVSDYDAFARADRHPLFAPSLPKPQATVVLQQATHYVWKYGTPFIALFDYKTLILLVMTQVDEDYGGQYTYMTVITDKKRMRKAYLGFLLAAKSYWDDEDDSDWRKTRTDEDLFKEAEEWRRQLESSKSKKNEERKAKTSDPNYVAPDSSDFGSDNSETKVQRD